MAKKTLALVIFLFSACALPAAKIVSGLEIMSGAYYCAVERASSITNAVSTKLILQIQREGKPDFALYIGSERAHSMYNLSRFSSAGDYKALAIKAGISGSFLSFSAGVQLMVTEPFGGSISPAFVSDAVLCRDARIGDSFVLRIQAGPSIALGSSFRSYGFSFGVMGLWR